MRGAGSYWQKDLGLSDRLAELAGAGRTLPSRCQFAIVGGGLAGLSTALAIRAIRPDASIVVLEAEHFGYGASGRSAGFVSPLPVPMWALRAHRPCEERWGLQHMYQWPTSVAGKLRACGGAEAALPEAEIEASELCLVSTSRITDAGLRGFSELLTSAELPHQLISRPTHPKRLSLQMNAFTLHPAKLIFKLAAQAQAQGIALHAYTPVRRLEPATGGLRIHLDGHELQAASVVVCTNGYTRGLDLGERLGALTMQTYMFACRADADSSQARTLDADFVVEMHRDQSYFRQHRDHLLYGGMDKALTVRGRGDDFAVPRDHHRHLARLLRKSFPYNTPTIDSEWAGNIHVTPSGLPIIRASSKLPRVHLNLGYGGTGIALSLRMAPLAAALATDTPRHQLSRDDARLLALVQSPSLPIAGVARMASRCALHMLRPSS